MLTAIVVALHVRPLLELNAPAVPDVVLVAVQFVPAQAGACQTAIDGIVAAYQVAPPFGEYAAAVPDVELVSAHARPMQIGVLHPPDDGRGTDTHEAPLF